jgi:hypothetical protein
MPTTPFDERVSGAHTRSPGQLQRRRSSLLL